MELKKTLLPSTLEIITDAILTAVLLILGNFSFLAKAYGLGDAALYFGSLSSSTWRQALNTLSSFSFTPTVVSFLLWFIVGLVLLSLLQILYDVYATVREDIFISTKTR